MNITVVGAGYVGMSVAVMCALKHDVTVLDIDETKIRSINEGIPPVSDDLMYRYMREFNISIKGTMDRSEAYEGADVVFIAVPTDFDEVMQCMDTRAVWSTVKDIELYSPDSIVCIRSTIPIGYTEELQSVSPNMRIVFSPEFLREGSGFSNTLNPSRIIVGGKDANVCGVVLRLLNANTVDTVPLMIVNSKEAEAIKLFSNSYLAMRVAFFNELDTFAMVQDLDMMAIVDGMGYDQRIGSHYNNPSFGYGGYCLPKDTRQLRSQMCTVPDDMMRATIESNQARMDALVNHIIRKNPKTVGIFKLAMKKGSDNFRSSATQNLLDRLIDIGVDCILFEPGMTGSYRTIPNFGSLALFKRTADLIVTNRMEPVLEDVKDKVFTRDLYNRD